MMIYKWKALLCWLFTSLRLTASQVMLVVKNLPANTRDIRDMGQEDPLEEGIATHSSIFAWRIPWTEKPGGLQSMGSQIVRHDLRHLSMHTYKADCTFYCSTIAVQNHTSGSWWVYLKFYQNDELRTEYKSCVCDVRDSRVEHRDLTCLEQDIIS